MSESAYRVISERQKELSHLIEEHPLYLPVSKVAEFLHVKPEALRASMEQGRCPFGLAWKLGDKAAYKVPTITFYCWVTGAKTIAQ